MLDLLIRGGLIIDGSGNPGFYGAVGQVDGGVAEDLEGESLGEPDAFRVGVGVGELVVLFDDAVLLREPDRCRLPPSRYDQTSPRFCHYGLCGQRSECAWHDTRAKRYPVCRD